MRMVEDLAREMLSSLSPYDSSSDDASALHESFNDERFAVSYNDLVQEGIIALLRAISTYNNYKAHATDGTNDLLSFERYAERSIRSSLLHFIAHSSRPLRLPLSLQTTLQRANEAAAKFRTLHQKEPTIAHVAEELRCAPERLALYRKLHRTMMDGRANAFVSVEDGMEVFDPTSAGLLRAVRFEEEGARNAVVDGAVGSPSADPSPSPPAMEAEGSGLDPIDAPEDDWTPPERIEAPLRDALADTEEINDPLSYAHHLFLNESLERFLSETLSRDESEVIRLRFGLVDSKFGGRGWSAAEIGKRMGMEKEEVARVARAALEKLRKEAANYPEWEEEDQYVEVSL